MKAILAEAWRAPPDHMQMFPDLISFAWETRLSGEMGQSGKCKHGVSEHGPTLIAASMSTFRSLTVISGQNDKRKRSENVLFPISS